MNNVKDALFEFGAKYFENSHDDGRRVTNV